MRLRQSINYYMPSFTQVTQTRKGKNYSYNYDMKYHFDIYILRACINYVNVFVINALSFERIASQIDLQCVVKNEKIYVISYVDKMRSFKQTLVTKSVVFLKLCNAVAKTILKMFKDLKYLNNIHLKICERDSYLCLTLIWNKMCKNLLKYILDTFYIISI